MGKDDRMIQRHTRILRTMGEESLQRCKNAENDKVRNIAYAEWKKGVCWTVTKYPNGEVWKNCYRSSKKGLHSFLNTLSQIGMDIVEYDNNNG